MPGKLNVNFILYTAFRLSPFIIVCFFTLSSILNQDLKGIIFLSGLLFATFIAISIGSAIPPTYLKSPITGIAETDAVNEMVCNSLILGDTGPFSSIPLGMVVLGYTFIYLVDTIAAYDLVKQNVPTFVLFPFLIIGEGIWNVKYNCASLLKLLIALTVGTLWGLGWARIIRKSGSVKLQYFSGISNNEVCERPADAKFKCTIKK